MNDSWRPVAGGDKSLTRPLPILIVERDNPPADIIAQTLTAAGYGPVWRTDHEGAVEALDRLKPGGVFLQLLPGDESCLDTLDLASKREVAGVPVIVYAPAEALELRVLALNRGADDYLLQPLAVDEILARLATVLIRREASSGRHQRFGTVLVDPEIRRIGDGLNWKLLTKTEWPVFAALLQSHNQVVCRQQLKRATPNSVEMSDNALEVMIYRLRSKLDAFGAHISAIRGLGYILELARTGNDATPTVALSAYSSSSAPMPSRRSTVCGSQVMGR